MSESVNAAQLASRKIKSAKGVRGKLGSRSISTTGGFGVNGTQSFASQETSSGAGLFGGGLNASGTFNFSAPVQGISFGTNSEAPTPFWGSDAEEDRRPIAAAEELERRNKPFRSVDGSAGVSSQLFGSTFQRTPLSALGQPNGLGSVSEAAKPTTLQISRSQSPAVPPFNFGATATQEQQPASSTFPFGQNLQAVTANESFRFGTPPPVQEKPTGNIFSFNQANSQSQPTSAGINLNSSTATTTTATEKPVGSIFSFGQTSTHPEQPSSSSVTFNSTPAVLNVFAKSTASNSKPTSSLFGQSNQQSVPSSNLFSNLKPQTATTNGIFGNQNQQSTMPPKRIFGESAPGVTTTSSLFGNVNQQRAPTSNVFSNLNQTSAPSNSLFNNPQQQPTVSNSASSSFSIQKEQEAPANATFDVQPEQPAPSSSIFVTQQDGSIPLPNTFGAQKGEVTPVGNMFGRQKEQPGPTNNIFGSQQQQSAPAGSLFGGAKPSGNPFGAQPSTTSSLFANNLSTSASSFFANQAKQSNAPTNIFATLNNPVAQVNEPGSLTESQSAYGEPSTSTAAGSVGLFGFGRRDIENTDKPSPFSNSVSATFQSKSTNESANEPLGESILPSIEFEGPLVDDDVLSRLENGTPIQPSTSNLFSSTQPIDGPKSLTTINPFANANTASSFSSPSKSSLGRFQAPVNGTSTTQGNELTRFQNDYCKIGEVLDSVIEEKCPKHFTEVQKIQFSAAYRVRSLNKSIKQYIEGAEGSADFSPVFKHYIQRRGEILEACETGLKNLKRKYDQIPDEVKSKESSPKKRLKASETAGSVQHVPRKSSPLKTQPVLNNVQLGQPVSPEKRPRPELRQPSISPTKKSQPSVNGSTTPKAPPPSSKSLFPSQQPALPPSPSPRGKRKAEVQIDKDHPTEEEALGASHKSTWHAPSGGKPGSATSSVFKSILDSPSQPASSNPEKKMFSLIKTHPDDKPRFNPFGSLPMPPSDSNSSVATPPSANPVKSNSAPTSDMFAPKPNPQASSLFPQKPSGSNPSSSFSVKPGTSQISSNISNSTVGDQASSPSAPSAAFTPGNTSGTSSSNPFAPKDQLATPSLFSSRPVTASPNMFAAKLLPPSVASNSSQPNPPISTPKVPNPFAAKLTSAATTSGSSSDAETKAIKPPTFAAPVNFLAQFGQKSKKSMANAEAEAMERAKEEDMDSDEDEAEWEAKYKEKRAAEKKATEELAKSKRATFVPGKGFTFDKLQSSPNIEVSASKSIFSQTSAPFSSSSNPFGSINRSEASSPGAASSRASSVFDGLGPPKPAVFGTHNIFGHLSDVDSGADSGKGNDADDDASDGESTDSNEDQDGEKKEAIYDPPAKGAATLGTAGTTIEETSPGIGAAKPAAFFNFGTSNSGASTPSTSGGSLFDRISKDPKGNPIRQIPAENKENAGLATASIFGGGDASNPFAKFGQKATADHSKSAQDNTWKPDSPIRFGASTTSPPTVNVTAPTPTKPTPFAGLFGSNAPPTPTGSPFGVFGNYGSAKPSSPASFTGIFGNSGTPKPGGLFAHLSENKSAAVGFGFGSTAGSSLLPSTAGSTATSRATSPGGTTDGESNNENIDPEAEHHEQIDLTSGGPGEENEEVLHQVRAKALKFEPSKDVAGDNDWVVKGLGPLRVLRNKETGSSRVLLRADPSGTIVLNKGILGNVTYTAIGKTLKLVTAGEDGQGLETWLLQVKTPTSAEELAAVLEANKRK